MLDKFNTEEITGTVKFVPEKDLFKLIGIDSMSSSLISTLDPALGFVIEENSFSLNIYSDDACQSACDVDHWQNVVQVATGVCHTLGLKADGTVYYAGDDSLHRSQVEGWTDVVQIDAGNGYSIALKADGSVMMAGKYEGYLR